MEVGKRRGASELRVTRSFSSPLRLTVISNAMDSGSRHNLEPRVEVVGKANHIRGRPMPNDMKRQKVQEGGSAPNFQPFQSFRGGGVNSTC